MDSSGASIEASVRMQSESFGPLQMEELFNYIRDISSKLDTIVSRLDVMERHNEPREKQNLEILKHVKHCSRNQAIATRSTDGQVFTSCENLRETGRLDGCDSPSEVDTKLSYLPGHSRYSLSTSSLEMRHETAAVRTATNVSDPMTLEINNPQGGNFSDKVVKMIMMSQSHQTKETEMEPERNPEKFAAIATNGVERLTINEDEKVHIRNEELVSSLKATTRAELIWLANQVDDSMSDIPKKLHGISADVSKLSNKVVDGFATLGADISTLSTAQKRQEETLRSLVKENKEMCFMKIKEAVDAIKQNTYIAKREIFAVVEKDAQLIRDKRAGPWPPWLMFTSYCFDFYVEDFGYFTGTGKTVHSLPWHINQFKSSVVGKVQFLEEIMEIWMVYGRDRRRVGFHPNFFTSQIGVTVTGTIIASAKDHQNLVVGSEKTWSLNEEDMVDSEEKGIKLGEVPCDVLLTLGYAGHENHSILVRYVVKPM